MPNNYPINVHFSSEHYAAMDLLVDAGIYFNKRELIRDGVRRLLSMYRVLKWSEVAAYLVFSSHVLDTNEMIQMEREIFDQVAKLRELRIQKEKEFQAELKAMEEAKNATDAAPQ